MDSALDLDGIPPELLDAIFANPEMATVELDRELVRQGGLRVFAELAWHTVEAEGAFRGGWHIDAICEHLEAVSRGDIRRLAVAVPPRHMKSLLISVFWPAWDWLQYPERRFLFSSYAQALALRDSVKSRRVIQSAWYQARWGDTFKLTGDQNAKERYENTKHGYRIATSVGGRITGEGGDVVVVDDPHNVSEAESEQIREATLRWWDEAMSTRLNDAKVGAYVIIQQRVHERDLIGHVIGKKGSEPYTYLCYDDQTEVLSERGWCRFADLPRDVRVMGVDPKTLKGQWEMPSAYIAQHYVGPMHHYRSTTADLLVTPDHRLVFKDFNDWKAGDRQANWRVLPAHMAPRHMYMPVAVRWDTPPATVSFAGREWDELAFAEFMGWYLSEGCTTAASPYSKTLIQTPGPLEDHMRGCLERTPFKFRREQPKSRLGRAAWVVGSKALCQALRPLGLSGDKRAPDILKACSPEALRAFLLAYARGDGHFAVRNSQKITIVSKSERMIDDLQECAIKAGWASSKNAKPDKGGGCFPNGAARKPGNFWTLYIRTGKARLGQDRKWYVRFEGKNLTYPDYDGAVHCVTVPSGALVVRRSGRPVVSGNCLPAEYEPDHPQRWIRDPRTELGEMLWPEHMPRSVNDERKAALGTYAAAAQLQQRPAPRDGGLFKRSWFTIIPSAPADVVRQQARAWDLAATEEKATKSDPDYTASVKLGFSAALAKFVILDVQRVREDPAGVRALIKQLAELDGKSVRQVVPQDPGQAGKDQAKQLALMLSGWPVVVEIPSGDKWTRAQGFAAQAAVGNVVLVKGDWNEAFLTELAGFPTAAHDDQVDAASSAFNRLHSGSGGMLDWMRQQMEAVGAAQEQEAAFHAKVREDGTLVIRSEGTDQNMSSARAALMINQGG